MFGQIQVTQVLQLSKKETLDQAVVRLLEFADYPKILHWYQFPTAMVIFLAHTDALDSGAIYVYDRKRCIWLWVDFNDRNYGGYSPSEFDVLINQCHFLRLVESPRLLDPTAQWFVTPGQRPVALSNQSV